MAMSRNGSARVLVHGLSVAAVLLLGGCSPRPQAPALRNDPIYQDAAEGFRFAVPEGWTQRAAAKMPPGKADRERLLTAYVSPSESTPATFDVARIDLPPSADLDTYLAQPSYGVGQWLTAEPAQEITIYGMAATRWVFTGRLDKEEWTREVVAFRRRERVYLFSGMFPKADTKARDEIRHAVESTTWKK
jgi:hypothetical protein